MSERHWNSPLLAGPAVRISRSLGPLRCATTEGNRPGNELLTHASIVIGGAPSHDSVGTSTRCWPPSKFRAKLATGGGGVGSVGMGCGCELTDATVSGGAVDPGSMGLAGSGAFF